MALYLVRERNSMVASLGGAMRSLAPAQRLPQIAQVSRLREVSESDNELQTAVQDFKGRFQSQKLTPRVTGIHFVSFEPEQAERLRRERQDLLILRDQPMELIAPLRPLTAAGISTPKPSDLWHLPAVGITPAVRKKLKVTGQGVTVAVLDTGIDGSHPEIQQKVTKSVRIDGAQKQVIEETSSTDTQGHGTHVAGLIAGKRAGVAPGASLFNTIMIPGGRGMLSDFVLAMEWCAQQPEIQIINMSAGIPGWVEGMEDVVADLLRVGVLPVIATGNEGANRTRSPGNYSEVLSVGATTAQQKVASFSSGGRLNPAAHVWIVPDLVAPGANVMSCVVGGNYEAWDGTSMATPIVSGLAALLLEHHANDSTLLVADIQEMLLETCVELDHHAPERQGRGLIQIHPALLAAGAASVKAAKKQAAKKKKVQMPVKKAPKKKSPAVKVSAKKSPARKAPGKKAIPKKSANG